MPAPMSAFAIICESIAGIDPGDVRAIDDFFLTEFARLDPSVREIAFDWTLSIDQEPTDHDREALNAQLSAIGFSPKLLPIEGNGAVIASGDDRQCA